jgi:hypothetical protein
MHHAGSALSLCPNPLIVTIMRSRRRKKPAADIVTQGRSECKNHVNGRELTYSIAAGAGAGKFQINPTTGALSFITAPDFDHPTDTGGNNVYDLTVAVSMAASPTVRRSPSPSPTSTTPPAITSNGDGDTAPSAFPRTPTGVADCRRNSFR